MELLVNAKIIIVTSQCNKEILLTHFFLDALLNIYYFLI